MSAHQIAVDSFLWIGVVTAALSALALPLSTEFFDRLHYMAPIADISAISILIAVFLQEGWRQATIKTILICLVLILMNAVLAHATARAARVRNLGHWAPQPDEQIRGTQALGDQQRQRERAENE